MFVIGTAGHVDHGKSTLVQALTGMNPDRLVEEQQREMTIDLGFAWLTLPSGRQVSIVDVPGHEDFIKNMLAGIGGIDVALFVVAADEGVMPQTREHLAILDLLQVPRGVVALTKSDLVQDPEWLELVRDQVREELEGTVLEQAAIVVVSAVTRTGLPDLLAELDRLLDSAHPRADLGRPRLPIDRAFTMAGFGTVVTGTLLDGHLQVGDEVRILPGDLGARIRGLQTHRVPVEVALPGSRVAVNLTGVTASALRRGQVVTRTGALEPTILIDARLKLLASAPWPLKHNAILDFFSGSARVGARVRLLDKKVLYAGQEGWVQFRLSQPVVVVRGDRYIVRLASPSLTLGGGVIVQPHPRRRHKRFRPEVLSRLEILGDGKPEGVLLELLERDGILEARELVRRADPPEEEAAVALAALARSGRIVALTADTLDPDSLPHATVAVLSSDGWEHLLARVERLLEAYHRRYPLRPGMPREELKTRATVEARFFSQVLEKAAQEGCLSATPTVVRLLKHKVILSDEQRRGVEEIMARFRANPFLPPSYAQVERALGAEVAQHIVAEGCLIKVSENVVFDADTHAELNRRLVAYLREHESATVAQVRDLFGTSRRYALGFLEDADRRRVTKRLGDVRVLR